MAALVVAALGRSRVTGTCSVDHRISCARTRSAEPAVSGALPQFPAIQLDPGRRRPRSASWAALAGRLRSRSSQAQDRSAGCSSRTFRHHVRAIRSAGRSVRRTLPTSAQGTIYSDVIESAHNQLGADAQVIKSHHNVGGLPEKLHLKLCEPLRYLFKDEARQLGEQLGLPHDMVYRHPFPGPGLGVRILGEVTKERCDILREADSLFIQALRDNDLYDKIWQAFAVLLPVKSVGVMGDNRTYQMTIALRAVTSTDAMTAEVGDLPLSFLTRVAADIVKKVDGVNRVVYDVTTKPPATIEWE